MSTKFYQKRQSSEGNQVLSDLSNKQVGAMPKAQSFQNMAKPFSWKTLKISKHSKGVFRAQI